MLNRSLRLRCGARKKKKYLRLGNLSEGLEVYVLTKSFFLSFLLAAQEAVLLCSFYTVTDRNNFGRTNGVWVRSDWPLCHSNRRPVNWHLDLQITWLCFYVLASLDCPYYIARSKRNKWFLSKLEQFTLKQGHSHTCTQISYTLPRCSWFINERSRRFTP